MRLRQSVSSCASAAARQLPIYCVQRDQKLVAISFDAAWGNEDTQQLIDIMGRSLLLLSYKPTPVLNKLVYYMMKIAFQCAIMKQNKKGGVFCMLELREITAVGAEAQSPAAVVRPLIWLWEVTIIVPALRGAREHNLELSSILKECESGSGDDALAFIVTIRGRKNMHHIDPTTLP